MWGARLAWPQRSASHPLGCAEQSLRVGPAVSLDHTSTEAVLVEPVRDLEGIDLVDLQDVARPAVIDHVAFVAQHRHLLAVLLERRAPGNAPEIRGFVFHCRRRR